MNIGLQGVDESKARSSTWQIADADAVCTDMDIEQVTESNPATRSTPQGTKRIEKKGRSKAKASMVFPVYKKGRRVGPRLSARQKKQSLKP